MTPCVSIPRRFAHTRTSATVAASTCGIPARAKMSVAKRPSASEVASGAWAARDGVMLMPRSGICREVLVEPVANEIHDQGIALGEHEMIDVGDQVEVGRLSRALEQLDRLLCRSHRVARRVQEEQRPRRDSSDDLVRVE